MVVSPPRRLEAPEPVAAAQMLDRRAVTAECLPVAAEIPATEAAAMAGWAVVAAVAPHQARLLAAMVARGL